MHTDDLRALSHHYLLNRLDKLPAERQQTLYAQYAPLMAELHEVAYIERKAVALLRRHQASLDQGVTAKAAAHRSLDDFIHLHANFNWHQNEGQRIPAQLHGFTHQLRLDYLYRKAADALVGGITACLRWHHSNN